MKRGYQPRETADLSVAVVICTVDRNTALGSCLRSLAGQRRPPDELILVQGGVAQPESHLDEVEPGISRRTVACPARNVSASRNVGIEASAADIVLFMDDDAVAEPDWIEQILEPFQLDQNCLAVGGDVYDSRATSPTLEFSRGLVSMTGRQREVLPETPLHLPAHVFQNVKGCNFAIRRSECVQLGGFDEAFAFAFDEADLMVRIQKSGARVRCHPSAVVHHAHVPGLFREAGPFDRNWYMEFRSHAFFVRKHSSTLWKLIGSLVVLGRLGKLCLIASGRRRQVLVQGLRGITAAVTLAR